jgi:hypothetical protein
MKSVKCRFDKLKALSLPKGKMGIPRNQRGGCHRKHFAFFISYFAFFISDPLATPLLNLAALGHPAREGIPRMRAGALQSMGVVTRPESA